MRKIELITEDLVSEHMKVWGLSIEGATGRPR